ncbi:dephospho-CoA kinase [Roseitranquillus sediminis]|uniref:dephospho-CoA kinase n=1 Tax=Roseitranquillus sediminis TaxID=2809051 RepID=UPI001D0C060F|nr:dephospho-CoA kinase [Roseitranquillus sediminis]MBM9596231.1 dephospho-CoA kinase [Roseitranquillus sediminis]
MTFKLGLTGSIGMGKTTTARIFADQGVPVWDADAAVHRLYERGGAAVLPIREIRADAVVDGAVDRGALRQWIAEDPDALARIEAVVHPLVGADRAAFLATSESDVVVLDIPLLYETGAEVGLDGVAVVSAPADIQRERVLQRPGMTAEALEALLSKQMPDDDKRKRADWIIDTTTLDAAQEAVHKILTEVRNQDHA